MVPIFKVEIDGFQITVSSDSLADEHLWLTVEKGETVSCNLLLPFNDDGFIWPRYVLEAGPDVQPTVLVRNRINNIFKLKAFW